MWSLLAGVAFALQINLAIAKVYEIPQSWNCVNNASLQKFTANGTSGSYRLVSNGQQLLLSDNGTFGLAFLNLNGTGRYYLSVMMGTPFFYKNSTLATPVWSANRNTPVGDNSVLTNSGGGLSLLDRGSVAWSSSTSAKQNISSLSLDEFGNLKLLASSGDVVWQSFDNPADVLLREQELVTGKRLTSNENATSMSEGAYVAAVEASGVVLYYKSQPYYLYSLRGDLVDSALQECPGFRTVLSFKAPYVTLRYVAINQQSAGRPCSQDISLYTMDDGLGFVQLGYDGDFKMFTLNESDGTWKESSHFIKDFDGPCQLPLPCGNYGICRSLPIVPAQCSCLGQDPSTNTTSLSSTCSKPAWASLDKCSNRYETKFVTLSGVSYFTIGYITPDHEFASLEDCLESCRLNCSCAALFYESNFGKCYFQRDIMGSFTMDRKEINWPPDDDVQFSFTAFLKYQNYSNLLPSQKSADQKLVIGLVSGAASMAVLVALCILLLFYHRSRKAIADAELIKLLTTMDGAPHKFSYKKLVVATRGFSKQLGVGGFGSVYQGVFHDGKKVAVKKLHSRNQGSRQFISEVASLGTINHINIVKLCGYCADSSHRLLVYDYMPKGSLDRWIFQKSDTPLSWSLRKSIALGIARGLAYLHEKSREPILHLDIKPQNILLDDNFVAKVADFGMARLLMSREVSQVVTGVRGTPGYLAPEWLLRSAASKKCDVYSYGMVLLELVGGRRNLDLEKLESNTESWFFPALAVNMFKEGSTLNIVDPRIREEASQFEAERLVKVAFWCIQENPADRPTMTEVLQMLEGEQNVAEPPMAFQFAVQATRILSITASKEGTAAKVLDWKPRAPESRSRQW